MAQLEGNAQAGLMAELKCAIFLPLPCGKRVELGWDQEYYGTQSLTAHERYHLLVGPTLLDP